jgi:hypothetical protein
LMNLELCRDLFWKELRLYLKSNSKWRDTLVTIRRKLAGADIPVVIETRVFHDQKWRSLSPTKYLIMAEGLRMMNQIRS